MAQFRGQQANNNGNHLEALQARHFALSQRIEQEQKSPSASHVMLKKLKAEKLRIKDEIEMKRQQEE